MDLFKRIVDLSLLHQNFLNVSDPTRMYEQVEFLKWAEGLPDRDGKFVREFQTTFNSSFWEVYLYAVLKNYGFSFDWKHAPDFCLKTNILEFCVEATTANAAQGKPKEWERNFMTGEEPPKYFTEMNRESIIRLSNAFESKLRLYRTKYNLLSHVKGKPFVLAIAPFEQPHFNLQYNRPITALLYDYYIDEDVYRRNPTMYPDGPPAVNLTYVTKDNGADIQLGLFNDERAQEISAVLFSCTATWGKVDAMANNPNAIRHFLTVWGSPPHGAPKIRIANAKNYSEEITDGLQIYHNPYAMNPLPPEVLRKPGVVQWFANIFTRELTVEEEDNCLIYRIANTHLPGTTR